MTAAVQQGYGVAKEIAEPLLTSDQEHDRYNSVLEDAIKRIEEVVASNPALKEESSVWLKRLQNQIYTNNHFVARFREHNPLSSPAFCVGMESLKGLKFLLRVGEDPNAPIRGKTALHVAAARGYLPMVEVLLQCPQLDKTILNYRNRTAYQLAKDPEIQALLA